MTRFLTWPIRFFLDDLRSNPLSRAMWGIDPPNRRRRRKALATLCLPAGVFLALTAAAVLGAGEILFDGIDPVWDWESPGNAGNAIILACAFSSLVWMILLLGIRAARPKAARKLWANRTDYRLAGLGAGKMLLGLAGPILLGSLLFAALYAALFSLGAILYWVDGTWFSDIAVIAGIGFGPIFAGIACLWLDVALWGLVASSLGRFIAMSALAILSSPTFLLLSFLIVGIDPFTFFSEDHIVGPEIASWIPRLLIVVWLWRKAIRKLDAGEFA